MYFHPTGVGWKRVTGDEAAKGLLKGCLVLGGRKDKPDILQLGQQGPELGGIVISHRECGQRDGERSGFAGRSHGPGGRKDSFRRFSFICYAVLDSSLKVGDDGDEDTEM